MSQESFLRAKLELALREAQDELTRLSAERLRLARKNEVLSATLYELRQDPSLSEGALSKIEEALSFDGQPWSEPEPEFFEEDEPSGTLPK
jgi:hypothetical protein